MPEALAKVWAVIGGSASQGLGYGCIIGLYKNKADAEDRFAKAILDKEDDNVELEECEIY